MAMRLAAGATKSGDDISVLLVDERHDLTGAWKELLERHGLRTVTAKSAQEAFWLAQKRYYEIVFLAEHHRGEPSYDLMLKLKELSPHSLVTIHSSEPKLDEAVRFLRLGAFSYLAETEGPDRLLDLVEEARELRRLEEEERRKRRRDQRRPDLALRLGQGPAMQEVLSLVEKAAACDTPVLLYGEPGVGCEKAARAIHALSRRCADPLLTMNFSALDPQDQVRELLGQETECSALGCHMPGRLETAGQGSLVLLEVEAATPRIQAALLDVLEEGSYLPWGGGRFRELRARLLATTHADLGSMAARDAFHRDFFLKLNIIPITIPPLRTRRGDIPGLCRHYLGQAARRRGTLPLEIDPEALCRLMEYPWPGNVRELECVMERLAVLVDGPLVTREDLPPVIVDPEGFGFGMLNLLSA